MNLGNTFFFVTEDRLPLSITGTSPMNNSKGVAISPSPSIKINFNKPISFSSVSGKIFLRDFQTGNNVPIRNTTLDEFSVQISFEPENDLEGSREYEIIIESGITDLSGNELSEDYTFKFETVDVIPPRIVSIEPREALDLIYFSGIPVSIVFSEAMDRTTLEAEPLTLIDTNSNVTFYINLDSYDSDHKTAFYRIPGEMLRSYTQYEYLPPNNARDLSGNLLVSNGLKGSFTTTADQLIPSNPRVSVFRQSNCDNKNVISVQFTRDMNFTDNDELGSDKVSFFFNERHYWRNFSHGYGHEVVHVPNPEFLGCVAHFKSFLCWLLPTTKPISRWGANSKTIAQDTRVRFHKTHSYELPATYRKLNNFRTISFEGSHPLNRPRVYTYRANMNEVGYEEGIDHILGGIKFNDGHTFFDNNYRGITLYSSYIYTISRWNNNDLLKRPGVCD